MLSKRANVLLFGAISLGAEIGQPLFAQSTSTGGIELEEIIVTAEKREASLQKTAVSVTALQGEDLAAQGQSNFADVLRTLPAVQVREGTGAQQPVVVIRGIQNPVGTDTSININIDGVYQNSGVTPIYDLERVEVLKGPQGTLYGRNALGGVVNMITKAPSKEFGGNVQLQQGNYNATRVEAGINLPFSDRIQSRTAAVYSRHDGYLTNGNYDENIRAVREKLLFNFTDDFSALLTGEFAQARGHGYGNVPGPLSGYTSYSSPGFVTPGPVLVPVLLIPRPSNPWYSEVRPGAQDLRKSDGNLQLEWQQPWANLKLLASYEDLHTQVDQNLQTLSQTNTAGETQSYYSSYEFRISNPEGSRLIWQTGAYYSRAAANPVLFPTVLLPWEQHIASLSQATASRSTTLTTTMAGFAQVTFPLTDALRLTGGVRYTKEELTRDITVYNVTYTNIFDVAGRVNSVSTTAPPRSDTASDAAWTGKLGFEYDLGPDSLLYADYSRGFKAGGLNSPDTLPSVAPLTFKPEYLDAFEVGVKNEFLNRTLRLNADAYYYKNRDKQYSATAPCNPNAVYGAVCPLPLTPIINASKATMYGVELQGAWLATPNDQLQTIVAWTHARFDAFLQPAGSLPVGNFIDPVHGHVTPVVPCTPGSTLTCFDLSGYAMPNAPEWTTTLSYEHTFRMTSGHLTAGGNVMRVSGTDSEPNISRVDEYQPSYQMFGARLEYAPMDGKWVLGAYGNNLGNEAVRQRGFIANKVVLQAPRTYGATLTVHF